MLKGTESQEFLEKHKRSLELYLRVRDEGKRIIRATG
jgi:hypothetical protein